MAAARGAEMANREPPWNSAVQIGGDLRLDCKLSAVLDQVISDSVDVEGKATGLWL